MYFTEVSGKWSFRARVRLRTGFKYKQGFGTAEKTLLKTLNCPFVIAAFAMQQTTISKVSSVSVLPELLQYMLEH